jgi:hypothetical protein
MNGKSWMFSKIASKAEKLIELSNNFSERRATYQEKISAIKKKLLEDYKFWKIKTSIDVKPRLLDIEKDIEFIKKVQSLEDNLSDIDKERINLLIKKHSVKVY